MASECAHHTYLLGEPTHKGTIMSQLIIFSVTGAFDIERGHPFQKTTKFFSKEKAEEYLDQLKNNSECVSSKLESEESYSIFPMVPSCTPYLSWDTTGAILLGNIHRTSRAEGLEGYFTSPELEEQARPLFEAKLKEMNDRIDRHYNQPWV